MLLFSLSSVLIVTLLFFLFDFCSTFLPSIVGSTSRLSILGPLLFLIFINHLPYSVCHGSSVALSADVLTLNVSDRYLQELTLFISKPSSPPSIRMELIRNDLRFNISKCDLLSITRKRDLTEFSYKLEEVKSINQVKVTVHVGTVQNFEIGILPESKYTLNDFLVKQNVFQYV